MIDNTELMKNNPRTNVAAVIIRDNKLLLAEFDNQDDAGLLYALPGGGVHLNETLHDAVKREVWEEVNARVTVGKLLAVWEYLPVSNKRYGDFHKVVHLFACTLVADSEPATPDDLDPYQVGIRWVVLDELDTIQFHPNLGNDLLTVIQGKLDDTFYGTIR